MGRGLFLTGLLVGLLGVALLGCRAEEFPRSAASLITQSGRHPLTLELALTPEQRARGLMFRETLPAAHGMLFDMRDGAYEAMWMKDTPISLDMLFLDAGGCVVAIERNTRPGSLTPIRPGRPFAAVLEIQGGSAAAMGVAVGDRLEHPLLTPAAEQCPP